VLSDRLAHSHECRKVSGSSKIEIDVDIVSLVVMMMDVPQFPQKRHVSSDTHVLDLDGQRTALRTLVGQKVKSRRSIVGWERVNVGHLCSTTYSAPFPLHDFRRIISLLTAICSAAAEYQLLRQQPSQVTAP
jgi:hypothetical protein